MSEREILSKILTAAQARNWSVEMLCGEEGDTLLECVDLSKEANIDNILDDCCQVDYERYAFIDESGLYLGWVDLIWGNGEDLIHDCSSDLMENFLKEIGLLDLDL